LKVEVEVEVEEITMILFVVVCLVSLFLSEAKAECTVPNWGQSWDLPQKKKARALNKSI